MNNTNNFFGFPLNNPNQIKSVPNAEKHSQAEVAKKFQAKLNRNVSQSQEQKMDIEEPFQEDMKISQSTQDSKNIETSNELENLNNINCASSHVIPNSNKNILLFEPPKNQEQNEIHMDQEPIFNPNNQNPIPKPLIQIPVPNPYMIKLAQERNAMLKEEEKIIFKFEFSSNEEYILNAGEYLNDIYSNLLSDEKNLKMKPEFGYMNQQNEINFHMRAILIDWLIEVAQKFHFIDETIYQAVWIIDTYLSKKSVAKTKFQLVGVCALFIACKTNEIYYPQINDLIGLVDNAYARNEITDMENTILKELKFNTKAPSSCEFYNIISKAFKFDRKQYLLGKMFLESSLCDYNLIKYSPSVIGASCVYVVMKFFELNNYKKLYSKDILNENNPKKEIKDAARDICFFVKNLFNSNLNAVKSKYSLPENLNVAFYCEQNN